jgi:hypothetical protein
VGTILDYCPRFKMGSPDAYGGLAGKAAAESLNPTQEDAYWRDAYVREPYYVSGRTYEQYRPAYELGWSAVGRYDGDFDAVEPRLADDWRARHATGGLSWSDVRPATRAAWDRASSPHPRAAQAPRALRVPLEPWIRLT